MKKIATLSMLLTLLFLFQEVHAQEREITGKITSADDKKPITGVTVVVKGTNIGAASDLDGTYVLKGVPESAKTLVFSAVGLKTKEIVIGTSKNIDVVLETDAMKLDQVVVTANAISREKRSLGYATQQVGSEELNAGGNNNMIGAIQGKVSGVNITSLSGAPGSAQRIVIRGGTSIARNNQALLIVDGMPIDNSNFRTQNPATTTPNSTQTNDLEDQVDYGSRGNDINPDDIESISVLKGPAATALYGSRASNGAIIITTKKGKRTTDGNSKMSISFNSNITFSSVLKFPEFQNQFGQGDLDNVEDDRRENFSWGLPFDGKLRPWGQQINGKSRVKPYSALPDNMKDFFDIGTAYRNAISFTGGSEKSSYYLSFVSLNTKGIVPTTTYDKYNVLFNGTSELANHFTTSISLNYSDISGTLPSGGQQSASIYDQIIQTPRDIPITEGENQDDIFNKYDDVTGKYGFYGAYTTNPYFVLNNFKNTNKVNRIFGNMAVTYSKWSWLSITNRFGGDVYSDRRIQKWKKYDYAPLDESGLYSSVNNRQTYNGKYSNDLYNFNSFNNDLMLTFKKELTSTISATLLLGQNVRQSTLTETYAQTNPERGLALPGYYNLENSDGPVFAFDSYTRVRNTGYYGDLNFAYKNMVFLGLTGRNDKTSTLPTNNNSYFYPGVNASFVFSELFKPELREGIWSYGKLRGSWAKVGNDASAYLTTDFYSKTTIDGGFGSTIFPFNGVNGYTVGDRKGNPEIKPEFTTAFEIGTELGFFKDRLSIDFSYYQNQSTDQIINLPLAPSTGFTSKTINTGEIENKGIELAIRGTIINSPSGFKWELYGTYTKNTNKVVSLYEGVEQLTLGGTSRLAVVAQVGQPYGAFYGADLQKNSAGNVVVDSATGMPQITSDLVYVGNYQPDYIASLGTTLKYKGFTLNVLFDTKQGGKFYSRTKDVMDFVGTSAETANREDAVWPNSVYLSSSGQYVKNDTKYHPYDYYTNVIPDGQHVVDASYVKLREASLTYNVPTKWIDKTPFGSISIALFGNNLAIWTAKENKYADPEQNSSGASNTQGFEFTSNPSQRNYGVDLKVTF